LCPGKQGGGALRVCHVASVGPKIELGEVAVKVGLADVVERAVDAALQQREVALDRIGMMEAARFDIFLGGMIDGAVARELVADRWVDGAFVVIM